MLCDGCERGFRKIERLRAHEANCPKRLARLPKECPDCSKGKRECSSCDGTGGDNDLPAEGRVAAGTCEECGGSGDVDCETCEATGTICNEAVN
jgi:hypothetical protein